ncbi:hypothetical protein [Streptomyces rubradiris]|uniref:Uncharacterized protein n=1 Tax=Streptomyces rubradiris TaxID=285531 RepID=A0ABQ3RMI0_STRRR|nr:hypothetical protein [Streptomyces rubradiris]GHH03342.1 hypothetical protein GCM10018792_19960 [Streptomyces rubradiris]GHI57065.1 hypothetical protein Srubr_69110 [Streptomyces rubradiris]
MSASARRRALMTASVLLTALGTTAVLPVATASAAPTAKAAPKPNPAARYAGKAVAIGKDMVAVLRNDPKAGGPEAWIRAVPENWRSGDPYMNRVLAGLDRGHVTATQRGLSLRLVDPKGAKPALRVTGGKGGPRTYALPKVGTPDARGCTIITQHFIGAGTVAVLSNGLNGPSAFFKDAGDGTRVAGVVNRAHPSLPKSAGFLAQIVDPKGAAPKLRTNMEGGGHPASTTPFPAPGCVK